MSLDETMTASAATPTAPAVVLIVEDRVTLRDSLEWLLHRNGFDVLAAGSAEEAFNLLRQRADVTLLLTDIGLPGRDGWSLARQAREMKRDLAVIYMSGHAADAWTAQGVEGSTFLQKPFALDELLACVAR